MWSFFFLIYILSLFARTELPAVTIQQVAGDNRSSSMGGGAVSASGPASVFIQPAVIGRTTSGIGLTHREWLDNTSVDNLSLIVPAGKFSIGIGLAYFNQGSYTEVKKTGDHSFEIGGEIKCDERLLTAAAGYNLSGKISVGLGFTGIYQNLGGYDGWGLLGNLGMVIQRPRQRWSLSFQRTLMPIKLRQEKESFPEVLRVGTEGFLTGLPVMTSVEAIYTKGNKWDYAAGLEFDFKPFALRGGYRYYPEEKSGRITGGIGIGFDRLDLEIGFYRHPELNSTISLELIFKTFG